jgi:hypothetical protein
MLAAGIGKAIKSSERLDDCNRDAVRADADS